MQSPVKTNEREIFMDILRGFAILGIFIANLNGFSFWDSHGDAKEGSFLLPGLDKKMIFIHHFLLEGKFYSIFSFLFGWGIALQLKRSNIDGVQSYSLVLRRLAVMLLLGAFHLMIWIGDIVFLYAMLGFILLFFTRFSNKTLLILAAIFLLLPILFYGLKMNFKILNAPAILLYQTGDWADYKLTGINSEEAFKAFIKNASWWDVLKLNISGFFFRYGDLFFQSRIVKVLGLMFIGVVIGRSDFYRNIKQHKKMLTYIIIAGLIIGLPANFILARYMEANDGSYYNLKIDGLYRTIAYSLGVAPLALAYIAGLMLVFQKKTAAKILSIFAPVGKMAFTNYVMHSLIGNFVFLSPGLGYMGSVGPVYYTLFAILIFIFQIIFSTYWLNYFNYGPLEWIWRSATYGKWQTFRKSTIKE